VSRPTTSRPAVWPWADDAACLGVDTEAMFPVDKVGEERALEVCARCEQVAACLDHAMRHHERYGVWGAMTEDERRAYRNEWQAIEDARRAVPVVLTRPYGRARCGTLSGYNTHKNAGQEACDACKQAMADYKWSQRNGGAKRPAPALAVVPRSSTSDYDPDGVLDRRWFAVSDGAA